MLMPPTEKTENWRKHADTKNSRLLENITARGAWMKIEYRMNEIEYREYKRARRVKIDREYEYKIHHGTNRT